MDRINRIGWIWCVLKSLRAWHAAILDSERSRNEVMPNKM